MKCRLKLCISISPDLMDQNQIYFGYNLIPDPGIKFCKIFEIKRFSHFLTLYTISRSVCYNFTIIGKNKDGSSGFLNFYSSPTSQFWYRNWNLHTGMRNLILVSSSMFKCTYQLGLLFHHHSDAALQSKMEEPNISAAMLRSKWCKDLKLLANKILLSLKSKLQLKLGNPHYA